MWVSDHLILLEIAICAQFLEATINSMTGAVPGILLENVNYGCFIAIFIKMVCFFLEIYISLK